jgi:hypothetical protein
MWSHSFSNHHKAATKQAVVKFPLLTSDEQRVGIAGACFSLSLLIQQQKEERPTHGETTDQHMNPACLEHLAHAAVVQSRKGIPLTGAQHGLLSRALEITLPSVYRLSSFSKLNSSTWESSVRPISLAAQMLYRTNQPQKAQQLLTQAIRHIPSPTPMLFNPLNPLYTGNILKAPAIHRNLAQLTIASLLIDDLRLAKAALSKWHRWEGNTHSNSQFTPAGAYDQNVDLPMTAAHKHALKSLFLKVTNCPLPCMEHLCQDVPYSIETRERRQRWLARADNKEHSHHATTANQMLNQAVQRMYCAIEGTERTNIITLHESYTLFQQTLNSFREALLTTTNPIYEPRHEPYTPSLAEDLSSFAMDILASCSMDCSSTQTILSFFPTQPINMTARRAPKLDAA